MTTRSVLNLFELLSFAQARMLKAFFNEGGFPILVNLMSSLRLDILIECLFYLHVYKTLSPYVHERLNSCNGFRIFREHTKHVPILGTIKSDSLQKLSSM